MRQIKTFVRCIPVGTETEAIDKLIAISTRKRPPRGTWQFVGLARCIWTEWPAPHADSQADGAHG